MYKKVKPMVEDKTCEKGTLGWIRDQAKKDGFDSIRNWQNWKIQNQYQNIKNIDQVKKTLNENKIDIKDNKTFYRLWSKINIKDNINDCWVWMRGGNPTGYGYFRMPTKSGKMIGAHCASYMFTKGPIPDGLQVQHICNNRLCCNPYHLELGDKSKNLTYAYKCNMRNSSGENNTGTILTEYQVREIHKIHKDRPELKQWQIAEMFKISQREISGILNGKRWHQIYKEIYNEQEFLIQDTLNNGRIESILISENLNRCIVDEIINIAENKSTEVVFISSEFEEGNQLLKTFNGMVSISRY